VVFFENVFYKNSVVFFVCTILATSLAHPKFSFLQGSWRQAATSSRGTAPHWGCSGSDSAR